METFFEDLKLAQRESEERYRDYLINSSNGSYKVYSVDEYIIKFNKAKGMVYVCDTITIDNYGKEQKFENKYDIKSIETGNVFLEFMNVEMTRLVGIAKNINWIVYNFPGDDLFYRFNPFQMLLHLIKNNYLLVSTYRDLQYKNYGFLIPLKHFTVLPFIIKERPRTEDT